MDVQEHNDGGKPRVAQVVQPTEWEVPWGALARVLPDNLVREGEAADAYSQILTALVGRGHLTLHQAAKLEDMGRTDGVARAILGLADHLVQRLERR